tara:strand:- start:221 stop:715 length:495 start_codon:yes stop_codon:yes gene_type:complete
MKTKTTKKNPNSDEIMNEALPAILPAIGGLAKKVGIGKIAKGLGSLFGLGGDDEKEAEMIAQKISDKMQVEPLDVESKQLASHSQILDDIRQILQGINASIAKLPQDPDAVAATGDTGGTRDNEVDVTRMPKPSKRVKSSKPKPQQYKVVSEGRRNKNNRKSLS